MTHQPHGKPLDCVAVIQARRGSSRLPDKILMPLQGKPVLDHVIQRCLAIPSVSQVVCALPSDAYNDAAEKVALAAGASVFRGSESDVLSRFVGAVEPYNPKYVMRLTADCPLLDPVVCEDLYQALVTSGRAYGATAFFPHGLDCEVFTHGILLEADKKASHKNDREHVTLWMKRATQGNQVSLAPDKTYRADHRWVLDYPEDLDFMMALERVMPHAFSSVGWQDVLAVLDKHPNISSLNKMRIEEWAALNQKIHDQASTAG